MKKKKNYYYKPNNMISISNLVFRMKKNAVGLATIAILSSMVLVRLVGCLLYTSGNPKNNWKTDTEVFIKLKLEEGCYTTHENVG